MKHIKYNLPKSIIFTAWLVVTVIFLCLLIEKNDVPVKLLASFPYDYGTDLTWTHYTSADNMERYLKTVLNRTEFDHQLNDEHSYIIVKNEVVSLSWTYLSRFTAPNMVAYKLDENFFSHGVVNIDTANNPSQQLHLYEILSNNELLLYDGNM